MERQKPGLSAQTFLVTLNEYGQKIYTSQTTPSKR